MAPNESTFLEPPATPAPLFAYRALRGFIFGSPDPNESPEREPRVNGKENIPPPLFSSRTAKESLQESHTPKLSPRRGKRSADALAPPVSPAKGILRTPGALTPRAKSLRDVNVKFRSVSPEVRRKDAKHDGKVTSVATTTTTTETTAEVAIAKPAVKAAKTATSTSTSKPRADPDKDVKNTKASHDGKATANGIDLFHKLTTTASSTSATTNTSVTTVDSSAFGDYQRRTERQMKMLIMDRNKWRDMARKASDENTGLKLELEQAQRENERLEKKLRQLEQSQNPPSRQPVSRLPSDHTSNVDRQAEDAYSHLSKKRRTTKSNSVKDTTTFAMPHSQQQQLPLRSLSSLVQQKLQPEPEPQPVVPSLVGAARTNLAPDRYSAARARLQARQQARKASNNSVRGAQVEGSRGQHGMDGAEDSNIDWAGLALG